jgi:hypothetical protein
MSRFWVIILLAVSPVMLLAQGSQQEPAPYQPAVPPPSNINSYGGYNSSPGTVAGSSMNGMANVISAKGNYNLSTSAAAINWSQAQRNEIQNAQIYTDTYFQMRASNRAARKAEAGPPPSMEQLAWIAHQGAPRPVTAKEVNPQSGKINWPSFLQQKDYAKDRESLEQIMIKQTKYDGLSFNDQMQARQSIQSMNAGLKENIEKLSPQEFASSRNFLNSMLYATCKSQL